MTLDDVMDKHWDCLNRVGVERHARDEMLRAAVEQYAAEQVAAARDRHYARTVSKGEREAIDKALACLSAGATAVTVLYTDD